jgi:replication-associated recombination protein RarA
MKTVRDNQLSLFILYGHPGIGKTTFAIKAATYLIERRVF